MEKYEILWLQSPPQLLLMSFKSEFIEFQYTADYAIRVSVSPQSKIVPGTVTSRCKFSQLVSQLLHVYRIHLILENVFFGAGL